MAKIALRLLCAVLLVSCVHGCSFFDIECKLNAFVQKVASGLIDKAQQAFQQAMDHVFDRDISPLLDKAIAAIDAGIDKVDKDVNETINHIESSIEKIIQDAAQTANALASNVTHDIEEIIRKATTAMEQVENTFYQDASNLLAQINQIVQKGQCMEASGAKQIQDQLYKLLKSLDPYYRVSSCWRSLGYKITMSLEDLTDIQLYNYQKECTLLNKITPSTPIEGPGGILETYAQGQLYAAEYYCIGETANAPAFQDVLSKEWLWWGVQYNFWKNKGSLKNRSRHTPEANQGGAMQRLKDDPCGTPVECYAQAIKALEEAEQKILALQTGLLNLNHTVIANQKEVKQGFLVLTTNVSRNAKAISTNSQAISSNTNGISTNEQAITTNTDDITSNSEQLGDLTVYPCNCDDTTDISSICDYSNTLSQGFTYYCKDASCKDSWSPVMDTSSKTGIRCCELCTGTAEEAAAYALANPPPPAMEYLSRDMSQAEPVAI